MLGRLLLPQTATINAHGAAVVLPMAHAAGWLGAALFAVPIFALIVFLKILSQVGGRRLEQEAPSAVSGAGPGGTEGGSD
ncbi:hypothetical protein NBH00_18320 [Paraconexibacter antarcticus]|uniref:Uncharacterized protein n=1 Tax=Paraconexibacter antarcticus TaxID=2949664 RepID=A0ABY5DMT5_9ACTN|nr:hypothetical protein [Paraconexibacter antarcticus]UTI63303.1 hypothetical protein NBH00_18320 [Paraconexibacter antarcticus]